jgi:putative transposase
MSKKRRQFSAEQKTKIVLEILQSDSTLNQIASKYEIAPNVIQNWKKQFLENASIAMEPSKVVKEYKAEIDDLKKENDELAKKLGKTTIELEFVQKKLVSLGSSNKSLVEPELEDINITRQCALLEVNRSTFYYKHVDRSFENDLLKRRMSELYTEHSELGYRMIYHQMKDEGFKVGKNKVLKLMQELGIKSIHPKKKKLTSIKSIEHETYPYLLSALRNNKKQVVADYANQVWSGDITYVPIAGGFMYLAAIIDWYSKAILAWKLSNTMDTSLVCDVLEEAIYKHGTPEIFNSDQGSQYTSYRHTEMLKKHNIRISMNGTGRSIDNIAIERFFRTLKYDDIYVRDYSSVCELRAGIGRFMDYYNYERLHSALGYKRPMDVHMTQVRIAA